jgi:hypothetical protein
VSHVEKKKRKKAIKTDRVEDSEDLDSYGFSSDDGLKTAIHAEPIDSRPPCQLRKNHLATTASKNRKSIFASSLGLFCCLFPAFTRPLRASRSSNDDISGSLDDQDHFWIETRDGNLETIAQSQGKNTDDTERKEHLGTSRAPKKASAKKDVILVTSSGGPPPESSCHVSTPLFSICFSIITPSVAPEGESKCSHLGLPSRENLAF